MQPLCSHSHSTCFGQGKQHFLTSSTLQCAVKIYSKLMEWAELKVSGLTAPSWKELGTGPVAFSTVCLWQLLSRGRGPNSVAGHSCPPSQWPMASHMPAEASCPQRSTVPVVEASFLSWKRQGDIFSSSILFSHQHCFITAGWKTILSKQYSHWL